MGLDNHISKYSKRRYVDDEIIKLFEDKDFRIWSTFLTFRGKRYDTVINCICDVSLYGTLYPHRLSKMEEKLTNFINNLNIDDYNTEIDVRNYIKDYDDTNNDYEYKIFISDLRDFRDIFYICAENNLYILANF